MYKSIQKYNTTQYATVDRGKLMMMMFEGGIKFLRQAKSGIEEGDRPKFARFLSKAQAVIAELQNTLDFDASKDVATQLDKLYDFMLFYLTEANLEKSALKVQKVIELMETISNAFDEVLKKGDLNLPPFDPNAKVQNPTPESNSAKTEEGSAELATTIRTAL